MAPTREGSLGEDLEQLIACVETALASDPKYSIERRKRLVDTDTGRFREHDVIVTWSDGHHVLTTALECRARSRPVGVPDVEAFHSKCQKTGINRGIIVSASGSTRRKPARPAIGDLIVV